MATILTTKICLRNDLAAQWALTNPVLLAGELGFERDTGLFKIGNGETTWNNLGYAGGNSSTDVSISVDNATITQKENGIIGLHKWGVEYYAWNEIEGHYKLQVVDDTHPWIPNLIPRAAADISGNIVIAWYESYEERIAASIAALQSNISELSSAVGSSEDAATVDSIYGRLAATEETIAAKLDITGGALTGDLILADNSKAVSEAVVDAKIAALGSIGTLKREIVEVLPSAAEADPNTIYMVKRDNSILVGDTYDEYVVVNGAWERIGNTSVDLSGYVEKLVPTTPNVFAGLGVDGALVDTELAIIDVKNHIEDTTLHITEAERESWNSLHDIVETSISTIVLNGTTLETNNRTVNIDTSNLIKVSDELEITEDGTLTIKQISMEKLASDTATDIVLNGGSSDFS